MIYGNVVVSNMAQARRIRNRTCPVQAGVSGQGSVRARHPVSGWLVFSVRRAICCPHAATANSGVSRSEPGSSALLGQRLVGHGAGWGLEGGETLSVCNLEDSERLVAAAEAVLI